ncbi:MAG: DMT family transporter [Desulfobacteraceae bacterium]|nr:DMT family transporter [Desulfobacteraceae bacterium]
MRTIRGKGLVHAEDARMLMVINFWGFTFLFTKLGLQSLDPLSFANLRVASAALALVAMAAFTARHHAMARMNFKDNLLALVLGLLGMACFPFCFSLAMNFTSAANAGLIFGTTPVAVALISRLLGMEQLKGRQWNGLLLSVAGISVILLPAGADFSFTTLQGDLLMVAAMLNWALYTVVGRFVPQKHSGLQFTAYGALWGVAGLSLLSIETLAGLAPGEVKAVSWLGGLCAGVLGTAVSYVIWNNTVRVIGPARTAVYLNLVPLIAAVSGFIILNESLGWQHLLAACLIIPGILMTRG